MKVYIVTSGEYSDYHIDTVCLDKEQAEKLAQVITDNTCNTGYVSEWDTDQFKVIDDGMKVFHIDMYLSTDKRRIDDIFISKLNNSFKALTAEKNKFEFEDCIDGFISPLLVMTVRAKDEEHAKKIAYDMFAEWKAEKEGLV